MRNIRRQYGINFRLGPRWAGMGLLLAALLTTIVLAPDVVGKTPDIQWTHQFGTEGEEFAAAIVTDGSAVYVAGGVHVAGDTGTILPGHNSAGGQNAFVRKYDANGKELWTRQFALGMSATATAIAVSGSGMYMAGDTDAAVPGQSSSGRQNAFVRKYDPDGNELWTSIFGTEAHESPSAITIDQSGVYVAGVTDGALPGQVNFGIEDAFIRKYDVEGKELWTHQFGTGAIDHADAVVADASGVYVAGHTGGALPRQSGSGGQDSFVRKYDADGNELWTRQFAIGTGVAAAAIAVATSGVYVAGVLTKDGVVNEGADVFVRRYDPSGNERWTRQFGSEGMEIVHAVTADASGVYVAGSTSGSLPGQNNFGGLQDAFVRKYDRGGHALWTFQFGTRHTDEARAVAVDSSGVYLAGYTMGSLPGQGNAAGQAAPLFATSDAFVMKVKHLPSTGCQPLSGARRG